jgi:hypothetical protein
MGMGMGSQALNARHLVYAARDRVVKERLDGSRGNRLDAQWARRHPVPVRQSNPIQSIPPHPIRWPQLHAQRPGLQG